MISVLIGSTSGSRTAAARPAAPAAFCGFLTERRRRIGRLRRVRRPVPLRHESTPFDSASFAECQPDHRSVEKALPAPVGAGQPRQKAS